MPITRNTNLTNSAEVNNGRYVQGGDTERFNNRLGMWERRAFTTAVDDITVTVDTRTAQRPDLIAFDIYNKANLQWLVLQYNNIVDVNTEIVPGAKLVLPTPARLQSVILTRSPGGRAV